MDADVSSLDCVGGAVDCVAGVSVVWLAWAAAWGWRHGTPVPASIMASTRIMATGGKPAAVLIFLIGVSLIIAGVIRM
jgi:hypothetical protein